MKLNKKLKYVLGSVGLVGIAIIPASVGLVSCSSDKDNLIDQDTNDKTNTDDDVVVENPEENPEDQKLKLDFLWDGTNIIGLSEEGKNKSTLIVPSFTTSISGIGSYSEFNETLTEIILCESIINVGNDAFRNCRKLTSINIPNSVTSIGNYAFSGCSSLASINIPKGVTSIKDSTFEYCASLTDITIPEGVTTIGNRAFKYCSKLTSITIPNTVTSIGDSAFFSTNISWEIIPKNIYKTKITDGLFAGLDMTDFQIPNTVTSIGNHAFRFCPNLTCITIPEGVTSIKDSTFYCCSNLTSITIPEGVTSIEYAAFNACSSLTSINIPDSVTSIGDYAFSNCSNLTSINIPESVNVFGSDIFIGSHTPTFKIYFHSQEQLNLFLKNNSKQKNYCEVISN